MKNPELKEDLGMLFRTKNSKHKQRFGMYECYCGNIFKCGTAQIKNGDTKSCGCYNSRLSKERFTTHGLKGHRLYNIWNDMFERTTKKHCKAYKNYGGRGISVCERWNDISLFVEDMYGSFEEGLTLERIDVNGNYEPTNCKWETRAVQSRNTRAIRENNKSGYRGVYFNKSKNGWVATITVSNKSKYIGQFKTAEKAGEAYKQYVIDNKLEHNYGN